MKQAPQYLEYTITSFSVHSHIYIYIWAKKIIYTYINCNLHCIQCNCGHPKFMCNSYTVVLFGLLYQRHPLSQLLSVLSTPCKPLLWSSSAWPPLLIVKWVQASSLWDSQWLPYHLGAPVLSQQGSWAHQDSGVQSQEPIFQQCWKRRLAGPQRSTPEAHLCLDRTDTLSDRSPPILPYPISQDWFAGSPDVW